MMIRGWSEYPNMSRDRRSTDHHESSPMKSLQETPKLLTIYINMIPKLYKYSIYYPFRREIYRRNACMPTRSVFATCTHANKIIGRAVVRGLLSVPL